MIRKLSIVLFVFFIFLWNPSVIDAQFVSLDVIPEKLSPNEKIEIRILFQGIKASDVILEPFELPQALKLIETRIIPERNIASDGSFEEYVLISIFLEAHSSGDWILGPWIINGKNISYESKSVNLKISKPGETEKNSASWIAPSRIWAGQSFSFSLSGVQNNVVINIPPIKGIFFEKTGNASFIATSITDSGSNDLSIELPELSITTGKGKIDVPALKIKVIPWQNKGNNVKAIGKFSIMAEKSATSMSAINITISGYGNFPLVGFPDFTVIDPEGKKLELDQYNLQRIEKFSAGESGYHGSVEIIIKPITEKLSAGTWFFTFMPFFYLDVLEGSVKKIQLLPVSFSVDRNLIEKIDVSQIFSELKKLAESDKQIIDLILLKGLEKGISGDFPGAARDIYAAERKLSGNNILRKATAALETITGDSSRPKDIFPASWIFLTGTVIALLFLVVRIIIFIRSAKKTKPLYNISRFLIISFLLTGLMFSGYIMSIAEKKQVYIVSDGSPVLMVPDLSSSSIFVPTPGRSATIIMKSGNWSLVRFSDGMQGWIASKQELEY